MTQKSIVIGVIPARYASQRLPAKALIDLFGKTMIQRVYEQVKKAALVDKVIVATDDERIERVVKNFGGEVLMTPEDIKSGSDRVAAVAEKIDGDIFVNIQGDEPLIAPEMIEQGIQLLIDDKSVQVGTLVKQIDSPLDIINPNIVKVVFDRNNFALYFSRSPIPFIRDEQEASIWLNYHTFYKHVGLYIYKRDFLSKYSNLPISELEKAEKLEQLRILEAGYKIKIGITNYDSIPIDTKEDVVRVKAILNRIS